jgi:uncharacterized protein YkwD
MLHAVSSVMTATTIAFSATHADRIDHASLPAKAEFAFHEIETELIEATNETREQHGLPPLKVDYALMRSARRHTAWMTNSRTMRHTTAPVGENIAMGQRSVRGVIGTWMNSSGHRANMLSGRYRRLGVAAYRTPNGTIYWCQQFLQ